MRVEFAEDKLDGGSLYALLHRHNLLPKSLEDPMACIAFADHCSIGFIHDEGRNPLAILLETHPEPGVVGVMLITERARLNQRRDELIGISWDLRDRWFNQMGAFRVETRIPSERTQTLRCFRHLGFKMETLPNGLRNASVLSGKPVNLCILSLLPADPIKQLSKPSKGLTLAEGESYAQESDYTQCESE